jgi:hypothetical protein
MALPKYGSHRQGVPVLDSQRIVDRWEAVSAASAAQRDEVVETHEPTDAERARTVLGNNRTAVVSVTVGDNASPIGFALPYAVDSEGIPMVAIRPGIERATNFRSGMQVSLAVAETPLTASHSGSPGGITMLGTAMSISLGDELDDALSVFSRTQPAEAKAVKRSLSRLHVIVPSVILVASGSGDVVRVDVDDYRDASSDPLAAVAPGLVSHLSGDENGSLVLLCRAFGGLPNTNSAELAGLDQYGMDLLATTPHGRESVRIAFGRVVTTPEEVRAELNAMTRGARFKLGVG